MQVDDKITVVNTTLTGSEICQIDRDMIAAILGDSMESAIRNQLSIRNPFKKGKFYKMKLIILESDSKMEEGEGASNF